jgi:hypothetical protein
VAIGSAAGVAPRRYPWPPAALPPETPYDTLSSTHARYASWPASIGKATSSGTS